MHRWLPDVLSKLCPLPSTQLEENVRRNLQFPHGAFQRRRPLLNDTLQRRRLWLLSTAVDSAAFSLYITTTRYRTPTMLACGRNFIWQCQCNRKWQCIDFLVIIRPRRSRAQRPIVIKLSRGRSIGLSVRLSVQCILEKWWIGSGCRLAS